jgi:hypothetical protein
MASIQDIKDLFHPKRVYEIRNNKSGVVNIVDGSWLKARRFFDAKPITREDGTKTKKIVPQLTSDYEPYSIIREITDEKAEYKSLPVDFSTNIVVEDYEQAYALINNMKEELSNKEILERFKDAFSNIEKEINKQQEENEQIGKVRKSIIDFIKSINKGLKK